MGSVFSGRMARLMVCGPFGDVGSVFFTGLSCVGGLLGLPLHLHGGKSPLKLKDPTSIEASQ